MFNKINKKCSSSMVELILLAALLAVFLASRIYSIDADIPPWATSAYCPIDEFYYTASAFDMVEGHHSPGGELLSSQYSAFNLVEQFVTAGTLLIFGDNYYGLRMPSVLAGAVVLAAFYLLALRRFGLMAAVAFSVLLMAEYSFVLASRIAEPTVFRMAAAAAMLLYLARSEFAERRQIIILGFVACFAWLFIYPTNAFLVLVGFFTVLADDYKRIMSNARLYIGAVVLCVILYVFCFYLLGHETSELAITKNIFSSRVSTGAGFKTEALSKLRAISEARYFVSHPQFLLASVFSLSLMALLAVFGKKGVSRIDRIMLSFSVCFLLQCAFINDYPQRKLVFMLPVCLYLCFFAAHLLLDMLNRPGTWVLGVSSTAFIAYSFAIPAYQNVYHAPQFTYKEAMIGLKSLGREHVIGGWGYGFRLYNDYLPYLNIYTLIYTQRARYDQLLQEAGQRADAKFTIEYGDKKSEETMLKIGFVKDRLIFKTNDSVYPDVFLYKFGGQPMAENQNNYPQETK